MAKTEFIDKNPPTEPGTVITAKRMDSLNNQVPTGEDFDGSAPLLHAQDIGAANAYVLDLVFGDQVSSGTNSSVTTDRLVDNTADFITDGVEAAINGENGFEVLNLVDRTSTYVTEVLDLNTLVLNDDIFPDVGDTYAIGRHLFQAPVALVEGLRLSFKAANANTGASTLNVNGIGAVVIKRRDGSEIRPGDIKADEIIRVRYNGSDFTLMSEAIVKPALWDSVAGKVLGGSGSDYFYNVYSDGDFIYAVGLTGSGHAGQFDGLIVKFDKGLNVINKRSFGGASGLECFRGVCGDGTYIYAVGSTTSEGTSMDALIVKFSASDLSVQAKKIYGGSSVDHFGDNGWHGGVWCNNTHVFAAGRTSSEGGSGTSALIVKFNLADLTIADRKVYSGSGSNFFFDVYGDTSYVYAVGYTSSEGAGFDDGLIVKFNITDLSIASRKVYGGTGSERYQGVWCDGTYVYAVGSTSSEGAGNADALIVKFNATDLTIAARKIYGGTATDKFWAVRGDDSYIYAAGGTKSEGLGSGTDFNGLIVKFNVSDLTIAARKVCGANGESEFIGVVEEDGFIYITGYTQPEGAGYHDCLIMRIDTDYMRAKIPVLSKKGISEYNDSALTLANSVQTLADSALTLADSALTLADSTSTDGAPTVTEEEIF
ncbi:MAG: hypothetical protein OEV42_15205 [Deltaproteobacteria bacterium]|nr:hypothetical protein [Deltaproteobacteria bacterium]